MIHNIIKFFCLFIYFFAVWFGLAYICYLVCYIDDLSLVSEVLKSLTIAVLGIVCDFRSCDISYRILGILVLCISIQNFNISLLFFPLIPQLINVLNHHVVCSMSVLSYIKIPICLFSDPSYLEYFFYHFMLLWCLFMMICSPSPHRCCRKINSDFLVKSISLSF